MKNKFLSLCLITLGLGNINAQYVGINTDTPAAALDIKSTTNDGAKVMRFSTTPSKLDQKKEFVLFAGEKVGDGYNLRRVSLDELFSVVGVYIPSTKRIVVSNNAKQIFNTSVTTDITLNQELYNSGNGDYELHANGEIEIKKDGNYDIASWIGFERLPAYMENDVILILNKKAAGANTFSEAKATIVSRSSNNADIQIGNGVGASFAFVDKFRAGDRIKLSVKNYLGLERNPAINVQINTLPNSVSLTITRVDSELLNAVTPTTP